MITYFFFCLHEITQTILSKQKFWKLSQTMALPRMPHANRKLKIETSLMQRPLTSFLAMMGFESTNVQGMPNT